MKNFVNLYNADGSVRYTVKHEDMLIVTYDNGKKETLPVFMVDHDGAWIQIGYKCYNTRTVFTDMLHRGIISCVPAIAARAEVA